MTVTTPMVRLYCGRLFYCTAVDAYEDILDGALAVDHEGAIFLSGERNTVIKQLQEQAVAYEEVVLPAHAIIIPGLIDLHVHLPQLPVSGRQEASLLTWLEKHIYPAEKRFTDLVYAEEVSQWFFKELLKNGTTTAGVFTAPFADSVNLAFETARSHGIRVVMGLNLMDCNAPDFMVGKTDDLLHQTRQLAQQWHGQANGKLQYAWVPRFALTSTPELLQGLGNLRKDDPTVYCHTHLSEQKSEIKAVLEKFPEAYTYTDVYDRYGLLGPRTLMAHSIHLSYGEVNHLRNKNVSLVHCPSANFFLKSGRFMWEELSPTDLRMGFGSDVGAGPEMSMFKVMKDAQFMQRAPMIPIHQLFYVATLGAARALWQEETLGSLEPGKQADFVVIDPQAKSALPKGWWAESTEVMVSGLVYLGDDRLVERTVVAGVQVYQRGDIPAAKPIFATL